MQIIRLYGALLWQLTKTGRVPLYVFPERADAGFMSFQHFHILLILFDLHHLHCFLLSSEKVNCKPMGDEGQ